MICSETSKSVECNGVTKVAVRMPGCHSVLTYKIPDGVSVIQGELVSVPLGKRKSQGVILKNENGSNPSYQGELKEILGPVDACLNLSLPELELFLWMSKYYHYSLGLLVFDCLPKIMKKPQPVQHSSGQSIPLDITFNKKQEEIFHQIEKKLGQGFSRHYLHGVTGSGKTLVYLRLIEEVINKRQSALFLVPEINLTPQFVEFFCKHMGVPVLSYHSAISNSEKYQMWKFLKENNTPVLVMGVRSAVFLPVQNLGICIVDEEHDHSFKQSDRCPYNGRDVAIKKSQIAGCPIVLGSATPTVENYYNFSKRQLPGTSYYTMPTRASGQPPKVEILDAKGGDNDLWPLTEKAVDALKQALDKHEQALVFINRLGFANFVQCKGCGHKWVDPNTGVNLRYFKNKNILSSSYSDYQIPFPDICPDCGNMNLLQKGFGTEKVQEVLEKILPNARIERFDRDEIKNFDDLERKLHDFHEHKIDIFVGTQMLSKGHNFAKVNLVLILGADSHMNFPDFRALEKTYQIITQVTGRAGRFHLESRVLIQTLIPDHPLFELIRRHSFNDFYDNELNIREMVDLPPFSRIAILNFSSRFRDRVVNAALALVEKMKRAAKTSHYSVKILGPTPAMIERRKGQFSWVVMLCAEKIDELHSLLNFVEEETLPTGTRMKIDVDPYTTI